MQVCGTYLILFALHANSPKNRSLPNIVKYQTELKLCGYSYYYYYYYSSNLACSKMKAYSELWLTIFKST